MSRGWWFAACCAGAPLAAAGADMVKLAPSPLELPASLGPMRIDGEPHTFEPAALGVSYQYSGQGLSLTIYIYDAAQEDIPDGGDSVLACEQLEEAKSGVERAAYKKSRLKSEQLVRLGATEDMPVAREAVYEYTRDGQQTISYIWVTAVAKNFVKLRFSLDARLRDEVPDARRAVLTELGAAMKPHLAPVAADAEKSGTTMYIASDANPGEMKTILTYQLALSAALDRNPAQGPKCGGAFEPPYETELAALRTVLAVERDSTTRSALGDQLVKVEEAGFLEELVWLDLHREAWGKKAPDGLEVRKYKSWRKKNLGEFSRPRLGRVGVGRPRPMAIALPDGP
jgi:hypothetical protein